MGVVAYLDSEEPNNIGLQTGIYLPHSCLRILENILIKNRTTLTNAFALVAPYYKSYKKKLSEFPEQKRKIETQLTCAVLPPEAIAAKHPRPYTYLPIQSP